VENYKCKNCSQWQGNRCMLGGSNDDNPATGKKLILGYLISAVT
ncbi:unnamed protein product, partial [marine sediment metagenome]